MTQTASSHITNTNDFEKVSVDKKWWSIASKMVIISKNKLLYHWIIDRENINSAVCL